MRAAGVTNRMLMESLTVGRLVQGLIICTKVMNSLDKQDNDNGDDDDDDDGAIRLPGFQIDNPSEFRVLLFLC